MSDHFTKITENSTIRNIETFVRCNEKETVSNHKPIEHTQNTPKTTDNSIKHFISKFSAKIKRLISKSNDPSSAKDLNTAPLPPKYQIKIPTYPTYAAPLGDRKQISKEESPSDTSKKVSSFSPQVKTDALRDTMTMYRMKAIRMLEKNGLCSPQGARTAVMNLPLEIDLSGNTCNISQKFPTVDGPEYRVTCIFLRENSIHQNSKTPTDYNICISCSLDVL